MFKRLKRHILLKEIKELELWLDDLTDKTEYVKDNALREVYQIKHTNNYSWKDTFECNEVKEELYQLLMHRQFIGYLAEKLRQETFQLLALDGKEPSRWHHNEYLEVIEKKIAKNSMDTLFEIFLEEIKPNIIKDYSEYYGEEGE